MRYISTRGESPAVSFFDAVLAGLAPDGGLYVPEAWPTELNDAEFRRQSATSHFVYTALHALRAFAGDDLTYVEAGALVNEAYIRAPARDEDAHWSPPWPEAVTPLVQIGPGDFVLELFHGPSLSFKDVAMQLIGPLYEFALQKRDKRLSVVCATSGDTGGAAVEALKGRERVDLFVLLPKGRVSDVQRYFMTASGAPNVHALEIDGDFDACQALVKAMFADSVFAHSASLSGVNSINWARIVAQSVYFHVAANVLSGPGPVNFAVPTGNFGDAFSGFAAKSMGAPIGRILMATNANDILSRALATGRYERAAQSSATLSPAMDIQVASNFERILFEALGRDGAAVRRLYDQFAQSGGFDIPAPALAMLRAHFDAAAVTDAETLGGMTNWDYPGDPHTAVALYARTKIISPATGPHVTLATAHPAKFPETMERATGKRPGLPEKSGDLLSRPESIHALPNELQAVKDYIRAHSRAWS
ncbi:MAG: threonine synthase [Caulobacterales bacterium]